MIVLVLNIDVLENYLSFFSGQFWLACSLQDYLSPFRVDTFIYAMETHVSSQEKHTLEIFYWRFAPRC
jgi:hypothetical protein